MVITLLVLQELGVLHNVWTAILAVMAMVAIGFIAVWSILSNVLSTFLILLYRPFRIGDQIRVPSDGLEGKVVDLNLMFTTLKNENDGFIQIPNNQFFQKAICRIQTDEKEVSLYDQLIQLTGHDRKK
jgi:small-conductance mechanosensitive channel